MKVLTKNMLENFQKRRFDGHIYAISKRFYWALKLVRQFGTGTYDHF